VLGYALPAAKFGGDDIWHAPGHLTFYVQFPALLAKILMRAGPGAVPAGGFVYVSAVRDVSLGAFPLLGF
jgi:hypothetical protein